MPDDPTPSLPRPKWRRPRPAPAARLWGSDEVVVERFVPARDGTRLRVRSWCPQGATAAPLVLSDGLGCEGYIWNYVIEAFRQERPVLHWQYRGHGSSEVPQDLGTVRIATFVDDLQVVLDAAGVGDAVFLGHSMGVQVLLEAHRVLSPRMRALGLFCGSFEYPVHTWHNPPDQDGRATAANRAMRRIFPHLSAAFLEYPELCRRVWSKVVPSRVAYLLALYGELNPRLVREHDFMPYLLHLAGMDTRVFARLVRDLSEHSARDVLPQVRVPTLVVGGARDTFAPVWLSREMHRLIAGSEYLEIPDGTHTAPIEHPELLNLRLEKFLFQHVDGARRA